MPMRSRSWSELTSSDIAEMPMSDTVVVLPLAALEQHGAHLPLGTDMIIAEAMIEATIEQLAEADSAVFLPVQSTGLSCEHEAFAGTVTQSWDTSVKHLIDLGHSLSKSGVRKLLMISSHGGNMASMQLAGLELRRLHQIAAFQTNWLRLRLPDGAIDPDDRAIDAHGGLIETAMMLAMRPDLVRLDAVKDQPSLQEKWAKSFDILRAYGPVGFGWMAQDLNPNGVVGNATKATKELGQAIIGHQARRCAQLIREINAADLPF